MIVLTHERTFDRGRAPQPVEGLFHFISTLILPEKQTSATSVFSFYLLLFEPRILNRPEQLRKNDVASPSDP